MGCPRTGRPGAGRSLPAVGALPAALAAGRLGAWYTGRGPVCGVITRRAGALGAAGLAAALGGVAGGGAGVGGFAGACVAGAVPTTVAGAAGGATGRFTSGAPAAAVAAAARGSGPAGAPAAGATPGLAPGAAAAAGFAAALAAGLTGPPSARTVCRVMAFSTSPGLEIPDRSILVFSSPGIGRALLAALRAALSDAAAAACARKCARTFSASSGSTELECVFLPVTPAWGR